jgi:hypothetical protein
MKLRLSARAAKVRAATLTGMAARPSRGLPAFWRALVRFLVRRGVQGRPDHHPPGALDASLCQEWMLNRGMKTPNCAQRTTQRQRDPPRHSRCWRPSLVFAAVLAGPQSDRSFGGLRRSSQQDTSQKNRRAHRRWPLAAHRRSPRRLHPGRQAPNRTQLPARPAGGPAAMVVARSSGLYFPKPSGRSNPKALQRSRGDWPARSDDRRGRAKRLFGAEYEASL